MTFQRASVASACLLAGALLAAPAQAAHYFQDFTGSELGATTFSDGSVLESSAPGLSGVQGADLKELRLTSEGMPNAQASFTLPPGTGAGKIFALSIKWNSTVIGAFPDAGGEFALNVGALSFTARNSAGGSSFILSTNGAPFASKAFSPGPQWGTNSAATRFFELDWNLTNGVTVRLDGTALFSRVAASNLVVRANDPISWTARNTDLSQEFTLDHIAATTGGNLGIIAGANFFASERNSNFGPMRAYDDDNTSEFGAFAHSGFVGGNVHPAGVARTAVLFTLTSGVDAPDPHDWRIEGGPNSAGPWTLLSAGDWNFARRQESRTWPIANPASFLSFRITFPTNNSPVAATYIGDLRLFEFKPVRPPEIVGVAAVPPEGIRLTAEALPGTVFITQSLSNFGDPWVDIATNTVPQSGTWVVDDAAPGPPPRFYRLRLK